MMKHLLAIVWLSLSILVNVSGCGGGNRVEYPENPDPMPKEPPLAAGQPAPGEQPKQAAPE